MPLPEQDPGSSEPIIVSGTPILESALPYTKERRIYDKGSHMSPLLHKRAEDTLDYFIPMARFLEDGETITAVEATLEPGTNPPLIMHRLEYAPTGVVVWLSAGADNERYDLRVLVTTSRQKEKLYRFTMLTRGTADYTLPEEPIIVTIEPITVGVGIEAPDGIIQGPPGMSLSRTTLAFSQFVPGEISLPMTFTLTNTGTGPLNLQGITATGDFSVSSNTDGLVPPGGVVTVYVIFAPSEIGDRDGSVIIEGDIDGLVTLTGKGVEDTDKPEASVSKGELSDDSPALAHLAPSNLALAAIVGESTAKVVTLTNAGGETLSIESILVSAGFTQTNDCGASLEPNATCSITVTHAPQVAGSTNGTLTIETNGGDVITTIAGTGSMTPAAPTLGPLSTLGNQFVDADGEPVRLKSINWFGAEGTNNFPHGIWANGYKILVDQIADWGFNCIRIPFSGDTFKTGQVINGVDDSFPENHDFITGGVAPDYTYVTPGEAMDIIIAYAETKGLYVVMDHHRRHAGNGADGAPTDGTYSQAQWLATWALVANRYKDAPNVIGADVHNEPHDLEWETWATLVEACGDHIHEIAPHWIIFCEGVGHIDDDHYWWGGQLAGVATRPVELTLPNKLAYSPHEYGQSVGSQEWLRYDTNPSLPANYPANLYDVWRDHWGFIFEDNIAPIWIGEFGGHYGVDGTGGSTKPHGVYERQWTTELGKYLAGDFTGSGVSALPAGKLGMSYAYWSFNPNSGDTGGLLMDDWTTPQSSKLTLIAPFLA